MGKCIGMSTEYISVLIAVIGAISGIVGGGLSGKRQASIEREKWIRNVSESFKTELRSTVKKLITKMAAAAHSMCWLCWIAKYGPNKLTLERVTIYDQEMHDLIP